MEDKFINKLKQVKNDVDDAKYQLKLALNILSDDVTINNVAFQKDDIDNVLSRLNSIISGVDNEIASLKSNSSSSSSGNSTENEEDNNQENNKTTPKKPPIKNDGPEERILD